MSLLAIQAGRDLAPEPPVPLVEPEVGQPRRSTRAMVMKVCTSMVILTVLTSRLALPLGAKQVPLVLPVALAHIVVIAVLTRGALSLPRLLATTATLGLVLFETALLHKHTSMLSLMYVIAIYAPLVVTTGLDHAGLRHVWRIFIGLAVVAAILGMLQIAVQTVAGGYFLDPVQLLPEPVRLLGYMTTYPAMQGVLPTLKANGMFFVEPSAFSQFLALALMGELWLYRRWMVLGLLAGGLAVSFSGTGLLMIAGGVALSGRMRIIGGVAALGVLAAIVLAWSGYGAAFASRVGELQRPGTSGYERFVAPFAAMGEPFEDSPDAVIWGYGAGRVEDLDTEYAANYSPVPKVFLEYGILGLLGFGAIWWTMFGRLAVQRGITGAMLVMYFLAAGSLLQPYTVFALWGLSGGFIRKSSGEDPEEEEGHDDGSQEGDAGQDGGAAYDPEFSEEVVR